MEKITPPGSDFAKYLDHTLLKPDAMRADILQLCAEAKTYQFASVCVNPHFVSLCAENLSGSDVKICTVIGFPLGAATTKAKSFETNLACKQGASEIDMVINIGELKSGNLEFVQRDIEAVVTEAKRYNALAKVIIETSLLNDEEKFIACKLSQNACADFVKTSTGFAAAGATLADVALMRKTVGSKMGVKASGGIRDYSTAKQMVEHGANRIGASASVKILEEAIKKS